MAVRVTQAFIEVWYAINSSTARVTQQMIEVLAREYFVDDTINQELAILSPDSYPVPSLGGPTYSSLLALPPLYALNVQRFKTGGRDFRLKADAYILQWVIQYDFLTNANAATLDEHWVSARGHWAGFDFVDPRSGSTFRNVHYAPGGLEVKPGRKRWAPVREIKLIWSSASGSIEATDADDTWDSDTWDSALFGE